MGKGLGGFFSSVFGSENRNTAKAPTLDPNAYQYGGQPGGAAAAAGRYRGIADQAQTRGGEQVNYSQAEWDRMQAGQARMGQQGMADQMAARAQGRLPSIAGMQADRQMQQATAAQASASASARGAGGMALAQQQAANNTANAHGAISGQAQINAANERMAAEQAAFGAYSGMRGGDQQQGQMSAQQAQFQSQLNAQQRAQNDQMTMGMTGFEVGVNNAQLGAQQNQQAQQSANALGASGINAGVGGQNAATNQQNAMGAIGMLRDAGGAGATIFGGKKADGGPTDGGKVYLVGEEGPELIVPREDGHVLTAEQTQRALAKANFGGARMGGGMVEGVGGGIDMGNSLGMSADMVRAASTGLASPGGITGMVGGGGITGGRADIGGMGYGGARAEGGPIEGYAPSTWGTGGPDVAGQSMAMMRAATAADAARQAAVQAQSVESPWARDVRQVQALRRMNPELINDEDDTRERRGLAVMGQARKEEAAKPKGEQPKPAEKKAADAAPPAEKKPDTIDRMQSQKPAEYHAMGGYVAPHLIPVPNVSYGGAREEGGPVEGSGIRRMATQAARWAMPGLAFAKDVGSMAANMSAAERKKATEDGLKMGLGQAGGRVAMQLGADADDAYTELEEKKKRAAAQAAKK